MTVSENKFSPDWISPTGDTIADMLDEKGWTKKEFASQVGKSLYQIEMIINGTSVISEETASRLETVLGGSKEFWLNREHQYRKALNK